MSTIFALASAPGRAGVSVIRISGEAASSALPALSVSPLPAPRQAILRKLRAGDELVDEALVIWFPAPKSFTGEDVVELHTHGSPAVVRELMEFLGTLPNFRMADAGEFSRRAFSNGKMDLTSLEGLSDLIDAETKMQKRQAIRQMSGELDRLYESWRAELLAILAKIEAYIDFPDEDIPEEITREIFSTAQKMLLEVNKHLSDPRGKKLREGLYAVILGAPNVGKSSLMNYLARRDVAIVSNIAGTTRDVIEIQMELAGFPLTICDTAGIRAASDVIEMEGVRRALKSADAADIKLCVFAADEYPQLDGQTLNLVDEDALVVMNKSDLSDISDVKIAGKEAILVSVNTGKGMDRLMNILEAELKKRLETSGFPVFTRERHASELKKCAENLENFMGYANKGAASIELAAEDLRLAARALGRITGRIEVEEILDNIFKNFCIGK